MGLRETAEADLAFIMEDEDTGWGWSITLTDPDGFESAEPLTGFSQDIGLTIDPETGVAVSGRMASATLRLSSIYGAGYPSIPVGIADNSIKPWRVTFNDINGTSYTFKVSETMPDRTLGNVVLILELYE